MGDLTIRNLDEGVEARLRAKAQARGTSVEQEARDILSAALMSRSEAPTNLAEMIRARFAPLGGVDLDLPERQPLREPPGLA